MGKIQGGIPLGRNRYGVARAGSIVKKAAALFRGGHTHVAQVMHRVGFNNQSYFTKCFGELFEMTPSKFIAAYKK